MKIYRIIAVALAAAFLAGAQDMNAAGDGHRKIKNRITVKKENRMLKERLDSLQKELERCRAELQYADSVACEMEALYSGNAANEHTGLSPEEYTAEVSDSLLNIWYAHRMVSENEVEYDMDSVKFESNVPDEVYIDRLKKMNSFISLPYNDIVRKYIILYSEKMPEKMAHMLGLCQYYMPIFEETFSRYDLPLELRAMAIIESALNPLAVSRAGAKGTWQFMYSTAKMYGLQIDSFVDERLDPVKSADAAAQYLLDAYEIFGDWNLAIASYNCGAGNVKKAIRRSGGKRAFWDIWPYLPRETRGYGPAFVGALYAMTYYKEHGIKPEAVGMPVAVDTFKINKQLHLRQVADLTGAPIDELKNLNPQYKHEIIPAEGKEYILRLPYEYTNAFIEHEDSVYRHKVEEYFNPVTIKKIKDGGDGERIVYRVKSGDYLGKIASRHRCTVNQIKRWNDLKSNNIRVGQRLVIYRGGKPSSSSGSSGTAKATTAEGAKPAQAKMAPTGDYLTYTVQSGDSFYSIAKNYPGVSAQNIMDFNGITSSKLKPGMKIKIPVVK